MRDASRPYQFWFAVGVDEAVVAPQLLAEATIEIPQHASESGDGLDNMRFAPARDREIRRRERMACDASARTLARCGISMVASASAVARLRLRRRLLRSQELVRRDASRPSTRAIIV